MPHWALCGIIFHRCYCLSSGNVTLPPTRQPLSIIKTLLLLLFSFCFWKPATSAVWAPTRRSQSQFSIIILHQNIHAKSIPSGSAYRSYSFLSLPFHCRNVALFILYYLLKWNREPAPQHTCLCPLAWLFAGKIHCWHLHYVRVFVCILCAILDINRHHYEWESGNGDAIWYLVLNGTMVFVFDQLKYAMFKFQV